MKVITTQCCTPDLVGIPSTNCKDIYDFGMTDSGLYHINLGGKRLFPVFCDMTLSGGGWIVIQRRINDDISFNRNWIEYRNGFGEFNGGNFWLGLQNIHEITSSKAYKLYIGMESFHPTDIAAASAYSYFSVGDESSKYALNISGFYKPDPACDGGDSLTTTSGTDHNGQAFSTPDQDNDKDTNGHCAERFCSGWWYHDCHDSHLNGKWYADGTLADVNVPDGIIWEAFRGDKESLKTVVMAIRPA